MYKLGLDLGSSYTKGVVVDNNNQIVDYHLVKTGFDYKKATNKIIDWFSSKYQIDFPVYTCGYGREEIEQSYIANS